METNVEPLEIGINAHVKSFTCTEMSDFHREPSEGMSSSFVNRTTNFINKYREK
jgi:hypothetical protein